MHISDPSKHLSNICSVLISQKTYLTDLLFHVQRHSAWGVAVTLGLPSAAQRVTTAQSIIFA